MRLGADCATLVVSQGDWAAAAPILSGERKVRALPGRVLGNAQAG